VRRAFRHRLQTRRGVGRVADRRELQGNHGEVSDLVTLRVRDFKKRKTVVVRAGHRYRAR